MSARRKRAASALPPPWSRNPVRHLVLGLLHSLHFTGRTETATTPGTVAAPGAGDPAAKRKGIQSDKAQTE